MLLIYFSDKEINGISSNHHVPYFDFSFKKDICPFVLVMVIIHDTFYTTAKMYYVMSVSSSVVCLIVVRMYPHWFRSITFVPVDQFKWNFNTMIFTTIKSLGLKIEVLPLPVWKQGAKKGWKWHFLKCFRVITLVPVDPFPWNSNTIILVTTKSLG